jgi:hypothetical protein
MAPTAASTGTSNAPIAPIVRGISTSVSPASFLIIMRLAFPSRTSAFTFARTSSPETLNSSTTSFYFHLP